MKIIASHLISRHSALTDGQLTGATTVAALTFMNIPSVPECTPLLCVLSHLVLMMTA